MWLGACNCESVTLWPVRVYIVHHVCNKQASCKQHVLCAYAVNSAVCNDGCFLVLLHFFLD
jgi:hypothetical protein